MGIGQVTLFANSPVPKGMLVEKIPNPHQILVLSQQRILQTFQAHLQTMESYFLNASSPQITSRKHGHQERSCPIEGTQFEPPMTPVRGMTPQNPPGSNTKFNVWPVKGGRRFGRSCVTIQTTLHGRWRTPRVQEPQSMPRGWSTLWISGDCCVS